MNSFRYFVLALVQGLTEFIPVSSSGHLALLQQVFAFEDPMTGFNILLHVATMLAVVVFTRRELAGMIREAIQAVGGFGRGMSWTQIQESFPQARLLVYIAWAFVPAALIGFWGHRFFERLFTSGFAVGAGLLVSGTVLALTRQRQQSGLSRPVRLSDAFVVGLAQAVAMAPGISRSGMTIAAGMFRGWERMQAARFSFLLSVPTIAAAAIYHAIKDGWQMPDCGAEVLAGCFILAGISGYAALVVLSRMVVKARFHWFGYYCLGLGVIAVLLSAR